MVLTVVLLSVLLSILLLCQMFHRAVPITCMAERRRPRATSAEGDATRARPSRANQHRTLPSCCKCLAYLRVALLRAPARSVRLLIWSRI